MTTDERNIHPAELAIPLEPAAAALLRLSVELAIEAYERDSHLTPARLAEVAMRGDEPFRIPPELLSACVN